MTLRNIYESALIELNKVNAPSLLISDFIYLFNKAVQMYINTRYQAFDVTQQLTDDLRVLTKTIKLTDLQQPADAPVFGGNYQVQLPDDYWHILNCVCEFKSVRSNSVCDTTCGNYVQFGAHKLNTNQWPHVIDNYYMKPSYKRPYFYIMNIEDPTKNNHGSTSTDVKNTVIEEEGQMRYGNATNPIMQIKCGSESKYRLHAIYVDYLRAPKYVAFTQEQLDDVEDTTQVVEFPDYVVYDIINMLVSLVMENNSNPRIQTFMPLNSSTTPQTSQQ